MKSCAPIFMAWTASDTSPCPVISTTGRSASMLSRCRSRSMPSMPGRRMSVTTTPGKPAATSRRAFSALSTAWVCDVLQLQGLLTAEAGRWRRLRR